jgi:hypothetical protein
MCADGKLPDRPVANETNVFTLYQHLRELGPISLQRRNFPSDESQFKRLDAICDTLLCIHNDELNDLHSSPNIVRVIK